MNAKTGTGHANYPDCIGRYGKGEINSNGVQLAELASQNELCLPNTYFPHQEGIHIETK